MCVWPECAFVLFCEQPGKEEDRTIRSGTSTVLCVGPQWHSSEEEPPPLESEISEIVG